MTKKIQLTKKEVKRQLDENGYCVCPNVLTPEEIKEKPGGKEFSTLNQLVIDTEEKVKGVPKGFEEAPKVDPDEIKKESEKTLKEKKKEVVRKVMRRKGYDSFNA